MSSNQKRRLEARGGRRKVKVEYVTQVAFATPTNTATGEPSTFTTEQGEVKQKFLAYQRRVPAGGAVQK